MKRMEMSRSKLERLAAVDDSKKAPTCANCGQVCALPEAPSHVVLRVRNSARAQPQEQDMSVLQLRGHRG